MKRSYLATATALAFLCSSCQRTDSLDGIISQKFVHKYGFHLSEEEWAERAEDGQVITKLADGVTICQTYENGELHGPTTHSFPHQEAVEKQLIYDQGILLKETHYSKDGIPAKEELYEFDERRVITLWDHKGVPLSIEEYDGELLVEGTYFTQEHELEARVEQGFGERVQRDREGTLLTRDRIENGILTERMTYYPNGQLQTISHYHDYQLHGIQKKFSNIGRPLMEATWNHGVLDGVKTTYRNGLKLTEVPYAQGQKHGTERHFDDLGNLIAEIPWRNDKKHGCSKNYGEESIDLQWFFDGHSVSASRFDQLQTREDLIAEFQGIQNKEGFSLFSDEEFME